MLNEQIEAGYKIETPSLALRFWRWLGYRTRLPEIDTEMEGPTAPGWIMTDITIRLSIGDRIRLLISGRANVRVETRTSSEVDAKSWSSFSVLPPGKEVSDTGLFVRAFKRAGKKILERRDRRGSE